MSFLNIITFAGLIKRDPLLFADHPDDRNILKTKQPHSNLSFSKLSKLLPE
jgi:hypothetical protein